MTKERALQVARYERARALDTDWAVVCINGDYDVLHETVVHEAEAHGEDLDVVGWNGEEDTPKAFEDA
jgi:hypothetical protein